MRTRHSLIAGLIATTALLTGCAPGSGNPSSDAPVGGDEVSLVDNRFEPANLEIAAGDTVTWVWEGRAPHNVVAEDFDSGLQEQGTYSHTFDEAGSFDYECTLHSGMTGQVTVAHQ